MYLADKSQGEPQGDPLAYTWSAHRMAQYQMALELFDDPASEDGMPAVYANRAYAGEFDHLPRFAELKAPLVQEALIRNRGVGHGSEKHG